MSDEDLIGYLLDLLDPDDRAAVAARLEAEPAVAARLDGLRAAVGPLLAVAEAERDEPPEPQPGLALRAIGRVAQHVVEHEPSRPEPPVARDLNTILREMGTDPPVEEDIEFGPLPVAKAPSPKAPPPTDGPESRTPAARFRADLLVAFGIAFVAFGLVLSGVAKARHQSRVLACQNSLHTLHTGLTGYADSDPQKRYPQVTNNQTAESFVTTLTDLGHLPAGYRPGCPATANYAAYTYTLGFRGPDNELHGLRRPDPPGATDEHDLMPIAADFPSAAVSPTAGPVSPHATSMNVLFVGGNVRLTTSANVGPRGDDIYRNLFGDVRAGANPSDAVLGRPGDRP
jgi:prepilin-type processing-associated H-X9-DG protein